MGLRQLAISEFAEPASSAQRARKQTCDEDELCCAITNARMAFRKSPSSVQAPNLVASRLAYATHVSASRAMLACDYPSEPVVAVAAAVL